MKKNIKYFLILISLFIITGCAMISNPTTEVEKLLSKYQNSSKEVIDQLDEVMKESESFTKEQNKKYHDLMKKQYQNLSYRIKEEIEDGNNAKVIVEIEVLNYGKALRDADMYLITNRDEFIIDNDTNTIDNNKFLDYKISLMEDIKEKVTYTINFNLEKKDKKWKVKDLNDVDILKIHGLYY